MRSISILLLALTSACAATHAELAPATVAGPRDAAAEGRSIVKNASLRLERDDPQAGPPKAVELAKAHGGYAQVVTTESAVVRVPEDRLDAFLAQVPALGKVTERRISAEDVTEAHRDLKVRLETLDRTRQRYLQLLDKAQSVSETVLVEKELERVTAEYESLKARLESVEKSAALATVNLSFERPIRPGPLGWVFYGLAQAVKWLFVWD